VDLPVRADPAEGGLVLLKTPTLEQSEATGVLRGKWGFDDWEGPRYSLIAPQPGKWVLADNDQSALVVGREDMLHFGGQSTLCVDRVEQVTANGNTVKLNWKSPKPELLEAAVPMKNVAPGPVTLQIAQFGLKKPDRMTLNAYAEAASLDRITLNAGDGSAILKGTRLDEVAKVQLDTVGFTPAHLSRVLGSDQLRLTAASSTANLDPTKPYFADVQLRDGRKFRTPVTVLPPRPQINLMSKGVQSDANTQPSPVTLGSADDLPVDGRLVFFLKSGVPDTFPRDEKVEVAAADGSFQTDLALADGSLMLEDAKTAMGSVEPLARFGESAFGPIRLRAVADDGTTGDWVPLGTLVRLPGFRELRCPHAAAKPCQLTGTNLFLATSIAATQDFSSPVEVPSDFTGTQLLVPHPAGGELYVKLRDDPATVQTLSMTPIVMPSTRPGTPAAEPVTEPAASAAAQAGAPNEKNSPPASAPATAPETQSPATTTQPAQPNAGAASQPKS
jgi:hypothetical protein